ncbi:MAG: c-type cytochrome [Bacteroidota bacterium]
MKHIKLTTILIVFILIFYTAINFASPPERRQSKQNHPPVVKIINPKNGSLFDRSTQVNYTITVSDKEDGDSRYDELNIKEVLLEVRYAPDTLKVHPEISNTSEGLTLMRSSNCFNCHNFAGKLIGPPLYDISKRYTATTSNITLLAKRIKQGAAGNWGKVAMPSHPELTLAETKSIAEWIIKNAANPAVSYYTGTEGFFKTGTSFPQQKGFYILTASYIDHGLKEDTAIQHLQGSDVIIISSK